MSRILFDKLPSAVNVAGVEFNINTDYRCMAKFENELLKCSNNLHKRSQIFADTLTEFYKGNVPNDLNKAVQAMWWFYRCGEEVTSRKNKAGSTQKNVRLYDYEIDGHYIAAAFRRQYNIDLTSTSLHWWLFRGYFADLNSDDDFVKIMSYRGLDLKQIKNRRERERYRKIKENYALPVIKFTPMTKEERDKAYKSRMINC